MKNGLILVGAGLLVYGAYLYYRDNGLPSGWAPDLSKLLGSKPSAPVSTEEPAENASQAPQVAEVITVSQQEIPAPAMAGSFERYDARLNTIFPNDKLKVLAPGSCITDMAGLEGLTIT